MRYTYLDDFITAPLVGTDKLQQFEDEAYAEVEAIGIENEFYKKLLTVYGTYKRAALNLLEAEGEAMKEKLDYYTKEWDRVFKMAKGAKGTTKAVYSAKLERA